MKKKKNDHTCLEAKEIEEENHWKLEKARKSKENKKVLCGCRR